MISFTIFETLFLITLASSFILILFLVYHFKSRILELEKRCDKLFAIVQSIAENMTYEYEAPKDTSYNQVKNVVTPLGSYPLNVSLSNDQFCMMNEPIETLADLNAAAIQHMNLPKMDDSDVSSDEDESEDGSDNESEDGSENEEESVDEKITVPTIVKVEEKLDDDDDDSHPSSVDAQFYKKMPVASLRQMATEKGLTQNANKLKKREIIELLCKE